MELQDFVFAFEICPRQLSPTISSFLTENETQTFPLLGSYQSIHREGVNIPQESIQFKYMSKMIHISN